MAIRLELDEALLFINGQWQGEQLDRLEVYSPGTGQPVGSVPAGGRAETLAAIAAAQGAFGHWSMMPPADRGRILYKWWEQILANKEELARLITKEMGKPLGEARGEVSYAADYVLWYAEEARRNYGELLPPSAPGKKMMVSYVPIGVVGAITPWNFPAGMVTRKVSPALAAGCTVVLKPAESTPLTALALADLADQAGLPPGVLNVVTGPPEEIGATLMEDPRVRKISFTGSTAVGKKLMRQSAEHVKRLSLELGGHAPFIVFPDADLDAAVNAAMTSKFRCSGQSCVSSNRFLVHADVASEFADRLGRRASELRVGDGADEVSQMGPLISARQLEKVEAQVKDAVSRGASVVVGGVRLEGPGFFFAPTVLCDVTPDMKIFREETFGPVAPVIPFRTEEEAVAMANDTEYGLAAYVFSKDVVRALRIADRLNFGMVGINEVAIGAPQTPHGGFKESGLGREGGHWGMEGYLEPKYVSLPTT